MTTQLTLYNDALLICGERFLSALTDNNEPRRLLDQVWSYGGVNYCLARAQWFFAMRTTMIDYDPSITPSFGYSYAFDKPSDWILTSALCSDDFFRIPITRYFDEAGYWYADQTPIYVRYVSNATTYGNDLSLWPESFTQFVAAYFASRIILKITNSDKRKKEVFALMKEHLKTAKSECAMASGTAFPAQGSWSRARTRYPNRTDGGTTSGNLY